LAKYSIVAPSYRSRSVNAAGLLNMNWLMEMIEVDSGKSKVVLYDRPGLSDPLYTFGNDGVRGSATVNGRTFKVAGTVLWEIFASGAQSNRGNLVSDGLPVSMAGGPTQLLIASAGQPYVFDLGTNLLTPLASTVLANIAIVAYSDGFFFALPQNSDTIQSSSPADATSWPGAAVEAISVFPDTSALISIFSDHRELWVFGPKAIQVYADAGDFPFPFDIVPSGYLERGLAAPFSVAKCDNSIMWLGSDQRGNGMVWRANGYQPQRISDHALEYELQNYPRIDDAVAASFQVDGHEIYQLNFPTAEKTKWYDASTQRWLDMGFWNSQAGKFTRFRGQYHTFNFGKHLVGDYNTGAVYEMSTQYLKDFGNPLRRVVRGPHICNEKKRLFVSRVELDMEAGVGPTTPLQGNEPSTSYYLDDPTGAIWQLQVTDTGIDWTQPGGTQASDIFLNDPDSATSWQITIDSLGTLHPVPVPYQDSYDKVLPFISQSGNVRWILMVQKVSATIGRIYMQKIGPVLRGPQVMLRISRDGGHTFGQESVREFGQAGEYDKRTFWNRLGSGRDIVPEISITDPVPARIIDAYLEVS
jgi:hypothetical protein